VVVAVTKLRRFISSMAASGIAPAFIYRGYGLMCGMGYQHHRASRSFNRLSNARRFGGELNQHVGNTHLLVLGRSAIEYGIRDAAMGIGAAFKAAFGMDACSP